MTGEAGEGGIGEASRGGGLLRLVGNVRDGWLRRVVCPRRGLLPGGLVGGVLGRVGSKGVGR